ncbi:ribose-phosphate pyrophosphokinase [Rossellomorea marisflavi]|uniref:ribose-phosphate pyrophosphokinase n=1 Tax=Rossellomorea marisflavi TaxID=189381 RepID=UPI003FA0A771
MLLLNNNKVEITVFPNGESKLDGEFIKKVSKPNNYIALHFESDLDLMHLLFLKKHLDSLSHVENVGLIMPYIPYSRMDRTEGTGVFTLKTFSEFINNMNFKTVSVFEPHSDVSLALIDRVQPYMLYDNGVLDTVKEEVGFEDGKDFFFYPDAGAEKRYQGKIKGKHLFGIKHRNFETGQIESFQIAGHTSEEDEFNRVIIVDDLSSYGGTFYHSAKALREQYGFKKIYLVVGHAENSILKGDLIKSDLVEKIFTTNSIFTGEHEKIRVMEF